MTALAALTALNTAVSGVVTTIQTAWTLGTQIHDRESKANTISQIWVVFEVLPDTWFARRNLLVPIEGDGEIFGLRVGYNVGDAGTADHTRSRFLIFGRVKLETKTFNDIINATGFTGPTGSISNYLANVKMELMGLRMRKGIKKWTSVVSSEYVLEKLMDSVAYLAYADFKNLSAAAAAAPTAVPTAPATTPAAAPTAAPAVPAPNVVVPVAPAAAAPTTAAAAAIPVVPAASSGAATSSATTVTTTTPSLLPHTSSSIFTSQFVPLFTTVPSVPITTTTTMQQPFELTQLSALQLMHCPPYSLPFEVHERKVAQGVSHTVVQQGGVLTQGIRPAGQPLM